MVRPNPLRIAAASLIAGFSSLAIGPAHAELGGILNARSADPGTLPPVSLEIAADKQDDLNRFGVRVNYQLGERLTAFANAGVVDFDRGLEGFSIGGGVFLHLPNQRISDAVDVALKPSINYLTADDGPFDFEQFLLGAEVLVSGRETIPGTPLNWYANAGIGVAINDGDFNDDTDVEPIFGGGIYLPLGPGQFYFGADYLDDAILGVGYRFFL